MKIASVFLLPLATQAALPPSNWFGGRRLALVVRSDNKSFSHATRDGGKDSASFYGEAPKGGGTIFRDVAGAVKGAVRDTLDEVEGLFKTETAPKKEDNPFHVGPFWESKIFKEGGLGFLFGLGTGVCVRKANKNAAYAVGGALVALQYVSRTDFLGCGGKLGWPKLDDYELRESDRDSFGFIFRAGRTFKHTVEESLETCEGYALGLATGLKAPLP